MGKYYLKLVGPENPKLKSRCTFTDQKKALRVGLALLSYARTHRCLGLSANQFGIMERVCVAKIGGQFRIFLDPQIVHRSPETLISKNEGCLSFPKIRGDIKRAKSIEILYLRKDEKGYYPSVKTFTDMEAIILQHEIDHLDGIRCIDKMITKKQKMVCEEV